LRDRAVQLPETSNHDVHARILSWSLLLQSKPRQRQQKPHASRKRNQNTESPIVLLLAVIDSDSEHDSNNDCQNQDLSQRLDVEGYIRDFVPLHRILEFILFQRDLAILVLARLVSEGSGVPRQTRECGCPVGETQLVGDQADDVEPQSRHPLIFLVYAQPSESDSKCDDTERDQNVGTEGTKICVGADEQQDSDLDRKRDTVAEQDDGVGGAI
jgi:hypothetical protein